VTVLKLSPSEKLTLPDGITPPNREKAGKASSPSEGIWGKKEPM
jgi:hypothetical protein